MNLPSTRVRDCVARLVTRHAPGLIRYLGGLRSRGLRVRTYDHSVEVVDERNLRIVSVSRNNAVYVVDLLKSFDYYFGSAEPICVSRHGSTFRMVDFSTPRYQMVTGFSDFPVLCPSLTEPYVTTSQYLELGNLTSGAVVLDLGCYSGLTSIAFSKVVGASGRVIAFEADPVTYSAAKINVAQHERINGLRNITLVQAAIFGVAGTLTFSSEGAMGASAVDIVGGYRGNVIEVEARTLMDVAKSFGLTRIDFVKMDIEGSELSVFESGAEFIAAYRPKFVFEPHVIRGKRTDDRIAAILQGHGYACRIVEQIGVELPLLVAMPG